MTITVQTETHIACHTVEEMLKIGIKEFCICPGARNSYFTVALSKQQEVKKYYWYEERSAAFFALGRSRALGQPVAVITTSGTAVGELMPAIMEAYYTGVALLVVTADRPSRFRNSGAPQSAEQVNIFGIYTPFQQSIEGNELCELHLWDQKAPAQLNVCLEEPNNQVLATMCPGEMPSQIFHPDEADFIPSSEEIDQFLAASKYPLVIVSTLKEKDRGEVVRFLLELNAPVVAEATSGLREEPRLASVLIESSHKLFENAIRCKYPIDGVLRIGGVPTMRFWRDLEEKQGAVQVYSINDVPFSGLSWGHIICTPIESFLCNIKPRKRISEKFWEWQTKSGVFVKECEKLLARYPESEPSVFYRISQLIPDASQVYLGNSLPIREWDLAAARKNKKLAILASRGLNGIDGQLSTFLGLAKPDADNWAIVGDLTALYDLAAPWILSQMKNISLTIVVVNNGGGKIFDRMYPYKEFQNCHRISFSSFASLWNMDYYCWKMVPEQLPDYTKPRIIEIVPDEEQTGRFWNEYHQL